MASLKEKKKFITHKLREYLDDVGFPEDGYEVSASCGHSGGYVATVTVFCQGSDRLIEEWELVSGDFADEVQDMFSDIRVEIGIRNVSDELNDLDEDGAEVYRATSPSSDDDDEDYDSDVGQYEEEGLSIATDEDLLHFTDELGVDDSAIDDLTLADVLNATYNDEVDAGYIPSEEDLEEFGFYDEDEDRRNY